MSKNLIFTAIVLIAAVAIAIAMWALALVLATPPDSAAAADAPSSESEPPPQVTVDDFKLLGCEEDICIYLVEVPYGDDCILAIQYFIINENVFDLECPRP